MIPYFSHYTLSRRQPHLTESLLRRALTQSSTNMKMRYEIHRYNPFLDVTASEVTILYTDIPFSRVTRSKQRKTGLHYTLMPGLTSWFIAAEEIRWMRRQKISQHLQLIFFYKTQRKTSRTMHSPTLVNIWMLLAMRNCEFSRNPIFGKIKKHWNRRAVKKKPQQRLSRSAVWWFTEFCNSHCVSQFAASFIVVRAKTSIAESFFV